MKPFNGIDLSLLPAPDVIHPVDFEIIVQELLADYQARNPGFTATLESDPVLKLGESASYREMLVRQRVNDASHANMVAYARGADLDNLAALIPLTRNIIDPGDPDASPPVEPTYESDDEFRRRVQMAPEAFSVAGSAGGYIFHALSIEQVKDAVALSPIPGRVDIYVLSRNGYGLPDDATLAAVKSAVNAETVRPLTDYVEVHAADLVAYEIEAEAWCQSGPASAAVLAEAYKNIQQLQLEKHAFGKTVPLSAIYAAIHVQGLEKVNLIKPVADLILDPHQVPYCTSIKLNGGGNG